MKNTNHFKKSLITGILIICMSLVLICRASGSPVETADVIYYNGKIITLDKESRIVEAVAVRAGKILLVGSDKEVKKLAGQNTKMIDLKKKTVTPGFIDAHTHPLETMYLAKDFVDCRYPGVSSVKQALRNISDSVKTAKKGEWIFAACVSASQDKFAEKRLPTKAELDSISPDNPVMVANGTHLCVVNSMGLGLIGAQKGVSRLPNGGGLVLDKDGNPTGTITDGQSDIPPKLTLNQARKFYTKDIQEFWNSYGYTSMMAITSSMAVPVMQKVAATGFKPTIRYTVSVWTTPNGKEMPEDLSVYKFPQGADPDYFRFAGIKAWIDGENDARTGYLYDPYIGHADTDPSGGKGSLVTSPEEVAKFCETASKNNVMCMLHCSGDHAVDMGLTAYENLVSKGKPGNLFRIEHFGDFQLLGNQLDRAIKLHDKGLRISVQPVWLMVLAKEDVEDMGPERAATGFRFRSMIDAGLEPAGSSDVTGIYLLNTNPFKGIYAAVTRNSDFGIFYKEQAISVTEALKMYTIWGAKSMGEEKVKGSLEPGKFADMVVLSDDILTIPPDQLINVKAQKTIVAGNIVYELK
jgi:predicted amidohydrolase YtcJ